MALCSVVEGDVVRVWVRGDNGELKRRPCVVVERVPPGMPTFVLLVFGCSETKAKAEAGRFVRIEAATRAFTGMRLDNATTFHLEDTAACAAGSPQLKKEGTCPRAEFIEIKRLVQTWKAERHTIHLLPEDKAPPELRGAVAQHLESPVAPPPPPAAPTKA